MVKTHKGHPLLTLRVMFVLVAGTRLGFSWRCQLAPTEAQQAFRAEWLLTLPIWCGPHQLGHLSERKKYPNLHEFISCDGCSFRVFFEFRNLWRAASGKAKRQNEKARNQKCQESKARACQASQERRGQLMSLRSRARISILVSTQAQSAHPVHRADEKV